MDTIKLLTEREAAIIAQVECRVIRKMIERGDIAATNYGTTHRKMYRIHPDALIPCSSSPPITERRPRKAHATPTTVQNSAPVWPPKAA